MSTMKYISLKLSETALEHVLIALENYDEHSDWGDQHAEKMEFRNLIDQIRAVVNT